MKLLTITLLFPLFISAQDKGATTITVTEVTFTEAANALLDNGYHIEKTDSVLQTIKTEFKTGEGKNKWMKMRLYVRIKDNQAVITGEWYNSMFIGQKLLGAEQTVENSISKIEYTWGNPKNCFKEMKAFAESFKKPVEYK